MVRQVKIVVEKTPDGYVAYPLGLKGIVVGQGDTYEQALSDVKSAIRFHIETFGSEMPQERVDELAAKKVLQWGVSESLRKDVRACPRPAYEQNQRSVQENAGATRPHPFPKTLYDNSRRVKSHSVHPVTYPHGLLRHSCARGLGDGRG